MEILVFVNPAEKGKLKEEIRQLLQDARIAYHMEEDKDILIGKPVLLSMCTGQSEFCGMTEIKRFVEWYQTQLAQLGYPLP